MSNERLTHQPIDQLEGLNRLAQALSSTFDIDTILNTIVQVSLSLCRAQHASILLLDPVTKETVKTLVRRSDSSHKEIDHTVNAVVAGWVIEHNTPLLADNLVAGVGLKNPTSRYKEYGSVLAVPLIVSGEIIGIINLLNEAGGNIFSQNSLRLASIIAQQSAQFIYHAKLHDKFFGKNQQRLQELQEQYKVYGIVGASTKMKVILETIPIVAKSQATILLCGETGTGKELVARAIHLQSDRAEHPFIALNCAAIPSTLIESEFFGHERGAFTGALTATMGKFELAHKGTIFLDEIAEMPLDLQPKLLRFLEERKFFRLGSTVEKSVDVRVIAATNRRLHEQTRDGKFREDLYYRLNVVPMFLPPLRERTEDIPLLAQYFLDGFSNRSKKFSQSALDSLSKNEWKGNVRELKNIVERISVLVPSQKITPDHLRTITIGSGEGEFAASDLHTAFQSLLHKHDGKTDLLEETEKQMVQFALQQSQGNVSEAARLLGVDRKALERRKEKFGI